MSRRFVVCVHDATPAFARETRAMLNDITPLLGRRVSFGVVPNWHGQWPLTAHPEYCRLLSECSDDLLLHGYFHRRQRGYGPVAFLTDRSDEMNGLNLEEAQHIVEGGQRVFIEVFGEAARGFVAPAWQRGQVRLDHANALGLHHIAGFFALESVTGRKVPLATWTWDCGRWRWLGHIGHTIGQASQAFDRGVPMLAIHPGDLTRGFWPKIVRLVQELIDAGYEPTTVAGLLEASEC